MEVDITRMAGQKPPAPQSGAGKSGGRQKESAFVHTATAEYTVPERKSSQTETTSVKRAEIERYLREVFRENPAFNKKLKFIVNGDLNQVIVKVIDGNTDKVIREIPPEALQKLRIHMKQTIGLIFDEFI